MKPLTNEIFIARARELHGERYDYSHVNYTSTREKVLISCKIHGEFWQVTGHHIDRTHPSGCPYCAGRGFSVYERIMSKVNKLENGCWEWLRGKRDGQYGVIKIDGRQESAHRAAYREFIGPIPAGMLCCHTCDNPICVNPSHLFLGTNADNIMDMVNKGRQLYGERNPKAILTQEKADEIRRIYKNGNITMKELGRRFGVSKGCIQHIIHNRHWRVA